MKYFKLILITFFFQGIISCDFFVAGTYPYVEEYNIPMSESDVINSIKKFKENHPEYIVPDSLGFVEGRKGTGIDDHWYNIYFLYPNEKEVIIAWTRPASKNSTTLAFVGIRYKLQFGVFKRINKDFDSNENEDQKKKFKERIVDKLLEH